MLDLTTIFEAVKQRVIRDHMETLNNEIPVLVRGEWRNRQVRRNEYLEVDGQTLLETVAFSATEEILRLLGPAIQDAIDEAVAEALHPGNEGEGD